MEQHNDRPERPTTIEWWAESSIHSTKEVSPDGRWHIDIKTERDGGRKMYLVNYDLLCSPSGSGESHAECWRKFIDSCGEYARRLEEIRAEAEAILSNLEK